MPHKSIFLIAACCLFYPFASADLQLSERDRDRLKKETVFAIDILQRYHYKQTPFQELDPKELINNFAEDLDGARIFLLQEDVDFAQQRFGTSLINSYLFVGDLYPAFEIFNAYKKRVVERLDWVAERLEEPFDLTTDERYPFDREDAPWPADIAEADELWEQRLKHELIVELVDDEPLDRALATLQRRYERMLRFLNEIEIHNVQETFLTSLARMYDPHSNFFSWDSAQEFDIQISNALVGIGAQLRDVDGYCVIERLMPGGPAEMSGALHPGDKIVAVAQGDEEPVDVVGMKLRHIVQQIRGEEGSEVRLSILPADSGTRKEVILIRDRVELTANLASAELFQIPDESGSHTRNIGVIQLPSFYGEGTTGSGNSTSNDVAELIRKLKKEGVEGIILDLRRNGGGRLDEAVRLTGLFIPKGPVVMKRSFDGRIEQDWDRDPSVEWDGPLAVLVSRSSASASEIVAGALQSLNRALVIGDEATHGKGTVQAPISLQNAMRSTPFARNLKVGTVKITVQQFFLPNGESTQSRGVLSDIALPSANAFTMDGEADLPNAMAWDQIDPIEFQIPQDAGRDLAMLSPKLLDGLQRRSLERQQNLTEFDFLKRNVEWVRERRERKEVSLNLEERRVESDSVEQQRIAFEDERLALSRQLAFEAQPVLLSLSAEREAAHQQKLRETPLPNGQSRIGQFYQKVFYYQDDTDDKLHEIWVENFDYDRAMDSAAELAQLFTTAGTGISAEQMTEILTRLKNRDRGGAFNILTPFRETLGDSLTDEEQLQAALPAFFSKMVELDPFILLDRPQLDVHLRETIRIVEDWITADDWINDPVVAATKPKTEE
jgi:carboxyl-terminal processing protease